MRLVIHDTVKGVNEWAAKYIMKRIKDFDTNENKYFTMGLATGSTPLAIYKILIDYHKAGELSFKNVKMFNSIDYVGLPRNHPASYYTYMYNNLIKHIDVDPENVYELNGNAPDLVAECEAYEKKIKEAGGIEFYFAGVGYDGHVAFDEPGSSLVSSTRVKTLGLMALEELSIFFNDDINKVPKQVLTVGIGTMMDSTELMFVLNGTGKAIALQKVIEGGVNHMWTLSAFQQHPRTLIVCDEAATVELKVKTVKYFKNLWDIHSKLMEERSITSD